MLTTINTNNYKRTVRASDIALIKNVFILNKTDELIIIWFDETIDPEIKQTLKELHTHTDTCSTIEELIIMINDLSDYKIILIVSGKYSHEVLSDFHDNIKIDSIFIFCMNKQFYQNLFDVIIYPKLGGIYTEYKQLFYSLEQRMRLLLKQFSIIKTINHSNKSVRDLEHESTYYTWFQLLRDSLMAIEPETSRKDMLEYCRWYYEKDPISLKQIDDFEQTYTPLEAVRWYTKNYFPFNFINKALRSEDIDALYNLRYFIINLSKQLKQIYDENCPDYQDTFNPYLKVYRGLTLSNEDIDQLKTYVNRYVSTNGFLSTSLSLSVAEMFAANVLFEITIDPKNISNNLTYAYIAPFSQISHEEEVLFDLGATFKIIDIKHDGIKYIVSMIAAHDIDCIKNVYIDKEREILQKFDIQSDTNFQSILSFGMYLMHMGQYDKSISYFHQLLHRTKLYEYERYFILRGLARSHMKNEEQDLALEYALDAYKINKYGLPKDMRDSELLLGEIYCSREEYDLALQCYERAIQEGDINDRDTKMKIHTNMAVIYFSNNNLTDGFEHSQQLLRMLDESDLFDPVATSDAHIVLARGYYLINNLNLAIKHCQKSLLILTIIFPDNNPILPLYYNELADMYEENQDYNLAIENYMKSMELYEKYPLETDLSEIKTKLLSSIGRCYIVTQQFDLSRLSFEKAIVIQETIILPQNEIKLADLHENIAICYWSIKDYDLTIQHYEMALELRQKISSNSIDIIKLYKQIGACYDEKKEYEMARQKYQKALELQKEILTSDELVLIAGIYSLLGSSYEIDMNYDSSLYYYQLGLNIREKCSRNDPETVRAYKIIAKVYSQMDDYDSAIENLKKALEIHEIIDPNANLITSDIHAKLASYYKQKKEYDLSIKHYEYATNIYINLPHTDYDILFNLYEQLAILYHQQNIYSSALQTYEQIVEISENVKQNKQYKIAKLYSEMSETYYQIDRYDAAVNYCTKSIEIIERHCNDQYNLAAKNNEILGIIYRYYKDEVLVETHYKKALELFMQADAQEDVKRIEKILENNNSSTLETSSNQKTYYNSTFMYGMILLFLSFFVLLLFIFQDIHMYVLLNILDFLM